MLSLLETGADLEELNHAQGLTFADADLRNISLLNAVLIHVKLERANFQGADLTGIRFQYGRLDGADFSNARLDSAKLGAVLEGARFFRANLRAASFEGASIKNVDLRCADVANITGWENLDLGGIRLAGAKNIPAGFAAKARNHRVQMDEPGLKCNEPML